MSEIERAAELLKQGRLVAFPTETVYGLGADALNGVAVEKIFATKGRPSTNPLIVHVASAESAKRYVARWSEEAEWLARRFWPGPLTLVLPKERLYRGRRVPAVVTAGKETVAVRVPGHSLALDLLRAFDGPVAAPSANRSTRVSPTSAQHVRDEFPDSAAAGGALENEPAAILDGGACDVGIESTVLDLSVDPPVILRPGHVTREQIEEEIGPITVFHGSVDPKLPASSPGQHSVHYAPRAAAFRFESRERARMDARANRDLDEAPARQQVAYFFLGDTPTLKGIAVLDGNGTGIMNWMPNDPVRYARELYRVLRRYDEKGVDRMYVEMPPDRPEWAAVRDRLTRATRPIDSE